MQPTYALGMARRPHLTSRLQGFGTTIFTEMSALASETGAVNLGQGFPDTDGPVEVAEAAIEAIRNGSNQYPPLPGIADLRTAIAEHQQRFWGVTVDPDREVLVTAGATEALTASMLALCESGDEVIVFDPTYDSYGAAIRMAGATLRPVVLHPDDRGIFRFDPADLRKAFSARTRLVLLNTPHNPTGKVFDDEELALIAALCVEHDVIAITDEVYEHLVFDGHHRLLATYPGMADRTVTISSGGKTFSFTGWKIGWACGPTSILDAVRTAKQFLTFVNGAPFQPAIAVGLRLGDDYFDGFRDSMVSKRDRLCSHLRSAGFDVLRPQGTYFATIDVTAAAARVGAPADSVGFCLDLPARAGVVAVPSAVFYEDPSDGERFARFCFAKSDAMLDDAGSRLIDAFG
jgi:N-succinyldiaminopimelate aminotransferase